ncbi:MAG: hypothetical protein KAT06_09310 [Gammaproteobacteria bacterium]|nr:hypothetical protein [Gammaproteobacteria bacterium]
MIEEYIKLSFLFFMGMSIVAIIGFIPLLLIQHFIHKKILDPIYFNSKYYSDYELNIFNSFPLLLVKTIGYIKAIVSPNTMQRKFEKNILTPKENPITYILAWLTMIIIICGGLMLINTAIMAYFHYTNM